MTALNEPIILALIGFMLGILALCAWSFRQRTDAMRTIARLEHIQETDANTLTETNEKLKSACETIESLNQALNDKALKHAHLEADLRHYAERLENKDEQLKNAKTETIALKNQIEHLSEQSKALFAQKEAQTERCKHLNQQLEQNKTTHQEHQLATLHAHEKIAQLQSELTRLETVHKEKMAHFEQQHTNFEQTKQVMKLEFSQLANALLEEKKKSFSDSNQVALEQLLKPFREQITHFQKRVNEVHTESIKGHSSLEAEIKKILDVGLKMSVEAHSLTTALKGNKKIVGTWGEAQVERTLQLAGLLKDEHYSTQQHFKDEKGSSRLLDFVLKLPDNKHIVIDSKVSLVDYERAASAETEVEQQEALKAHSIAIKNHIDDLANKDYSSLPGLNGPSFVLMFMPIEPAYIEALKANKTLFDYGYKQNVVLVSYTTLLPLLRTVAHLWMMEKSHKEARLLSDRAGNIYDQVCIMAERLVKLGGSIQAAGNHYNTAIKSLVGKQGLYAKVQRFSTLATKVTKTMPEMNTLHQDLDISRLEVLLPPSSESAPSPEEQAEPSPSV